MDFDFECGRAAIIGDDVEYEVRCSRDEVYEHAGQDKKGFGMPNV